MFLPRKVLEERMRRFLEEDLGQGDITTSLVIPSGTIVEAEVVVKETGIVAGIEEALAILESFQLQATALVSDGSKVNKGTRMLRIGGDARTLLTLERTLLNLVSRMSGIATATNKLVEKVTRVNLKTRIASTRKVAPGFEYFDKKAVMLGGGDSHRLHLDDMILIKDNHLAIIGDISKTIKQVKGKVSFTKKVEAEVTTAEDALKAARAGADIIMLDNMSPKKIREAIAMLKKERLRDKVLVEASGGIREKNVLEFAATGVDIVSLSEITEAARALDMSLEIVKVRKPSKK